MNDAGESLVGEAKRVFRIEAEAILALGERIGPSFDRAVETLMSCRGRAVVTGMGKSGIIGRKLAATLASVGTPALYLHPAEGGHGDIGMLARGDCVLALSRSGETDEILQLLPAVKRLGVPLIALAGVPGSTLAREASIFLDVSVAEEACTLDLVPTSSTAAMLAMGDALAVAVMRRRGLTEQDYARLHPAGSLGRRLLLRVSDIMRRGAEVPSVAAGTTIKDAIIEMTAKKLGSTCVTGPDGKLLGILTDHDLRRALEKGGASALSGKVEDAMTRAPMTAGPDMLVAEVIAMTEAKSVSVIPVAGPDGLVAGVVHLHDLLRSGVL